MNQARLSYIIETIKPIDCKVEFLTEVSDMAPIGSCYRPDIKTIFVLPLDKHANIRSFSTVLTDYEKSIFQERSLLHEIGHHITWNPKWRLYGSSDGMITNRNIGNCIMCSDDLYGAEYLAEKFFRDQCKIYDWYDLLVISNKSIKYILEQITTPVPIGDSWGYHYMALRIAREEKL